MRPPFRHHEFVFFFDLAAGSLALEKDRGTHVSVTMYGRRHAVSHEARQLAPAKGWHNTGTRGWGWFGRARVMSSIVLSMSKKEEMKREAKNNASGRQGPTCYSAETRSPLRARACSFHDRELA